jgi:hypothetical protein
MQTLQVNQSVAFQTRVQRFSTAQRFAAPLAPVAQKPRKPTSYKMVYIPKTLSWIAKSKVVRPPAQDYIDLLDRLAQRSFIAAAGLGPNFVFEPLYGTFTGIHIQVVPVAASQIPIITECKAQKIQRFSGAAHLDDARLFPVQLQTQVPFEPVPDPVFNPRPDVSGQYHQIIRITHQSRVGHLVWPPRILIKGSIKPIKVDVGQQRRDHAPLRGSSLAGSASAFAAFFHHRAFEPHPDQLQHRPVCYAPLDLSQQFVVVDAVKVTRKVCIIHLPPAFMQVISNLIKGSVSTTPGAKTVRAVHKIGLKYRLDHQQCGRLDHAIPDTGNAQRPLFAVGFGNVYSQNRRWTIPAAAKRLLDLVDKRRHSPALRFNTADTDAVNPGCSLLGSHPLPGRLQNVPAKDAVIERVEPKQRLSLGLLAQFPSQKGDFDRHARLRLEPLCHIFRNGAFAAQAGHPSFDQNMTEVRPLGSAPFPGLLRYYGPLRLPAADVVQVMDSLTTLPLTGTAPGLPGSSTDLSARALPNHPGRLDRCSRSLLPCRWQASPNLGGWPPPDKCNEAESGSLALGLAPSLSGKDHFLSPLESQSRDRPAPRVRLPCT